MTPFHAVTFLLSRVEKQTLLVNAATFKDWELCIVADQKSSYSQKLKEKLKVRKASLKKVGKKGVDNEHWKYKNISNPSLSFN